jgi:protein transport protein SEC61 subunit alpha
LTLGSVFTTYIGERISDLKLGNGTSLLIFTSIISYLPASFGRTVSQAFQDGNYIGLIAIVISFFLLVLSIVYVQVSAAYIFLTKMSLEVNKCSQLYQQRVSGSGEENST